MKYDTEKDNSKQVADKQTNENIFVKKYSHLNLSAYPSSNISESDVIVDLSSPLKKAVLKWKENGKTKSAYTKEFMDANAEEKWKRVDRITDAEIKTIDDYSDKLLKSNNEKEKELGAIFKMLRITGLRVGTIANKTGTGNRGISSLSPDNIEIDGDTVKLDFIGKSHQHNTSQFVDKELAEYLKNKKKEKEGSNYIFSISWDAIDDNFAKIVPRLKIKDLRTYKANETAISFLKNDNIPPIPLPEKDKDIQKSIENKLNKCFEKVSSVLNNTPQMAKKSYVIPKTIDNWLDDLSVEVVENKYKVKEKQNNIHESVEIISNNNMKYESPEIENEYDEVDYYNLPVWFGNDNYTIVRKK